MSTEHLKSEILGKYMRRNSHSLYRIERATPPSQSITDRQTESIDIDRDCVKPQTNRHTGLDADSICHRDRTQELPIELPPLPQGPPLPQPPHPSQEVMLVPVLQQLLGLKSTLHPPLFRFDITKEAAHHNLQLLIDKKFQLESILNDPSRPSVTSYGSEFKSPESLHLLLHRHPRWPIMKQLLQQGSKWNMIEVKEEERRKDMKAALHRGNHKSANKHQGFLVQALSKEIVKGWELLLPATAVDSLPHLVLSPMGVAEHLGVQEDGSFAPKMRVTHDLSFPGAVSAHSVNSRLLDSDLEPCMFGHALLRLIHRIVHLRQLYPKRRIWMRKDDAKSAYRRVHLNVATVFQTAVQLVLAGVQYILLALRLPFGGSACPSEFCLISDIIADVTNDLFADMSWDPEVVSSTYLNQVPAPRGLPSDIPFAPARSTSVPNIEGAKCSADVFIDDVITVGVDVGINVLKLRAGPCTVMHAIAQPADYSTTIHRQDFIAADKNEAEGGPEETKIILGWLIDSRRLLIQLPNHKHTAWSSQLSSFTTRKSANSKDLQSLLG